MTIGVYKSNKNAGRFRFHRKKTKKEWKHYFIDIDEDYGNTFGSEWVSGFKARILKRKQQYKRTFVCTNCWKRWTQYVPKNCHEVDECPFCED